MIDKFTLSYNTFTFLHNFFQPKGDIILSLNGGSESTVGISMDLATEQVVDLWSPNNDTFHSAHDMAMSHDERSFYVCQFSGNNSKVIKFNFVESSQMLLIN